MAPHIFLSYSHRDVYRVRRLREGLRLYGLPVWPEGRLTPGTDDWRAGLYDAVAGAACVVIALSPDTRLSGWVRWALTLAEEQRLPLLPVVISGQAGHIMLVELAGTDWFDLRWSWNYEREIEALAILARHYIGVRTIEVSR
jgi:hypothetical protein